MATSVILRIAYGYSVTDEKDDLVDLAQDVMHRLAAAITPNNYLADALPFRMKPAYELQSGLKICFCDSAIYSGVDPRSQIPEASSGDPASFEPLHKRTFFDSFGPTSLSVFAHLIGAYRRITGGWHRTSLFHIERPHERRIQESKGHGSFEVGRRRDIWR